MKQYLVRSFKHDELGTDLEVSLYLNDHAVRGWKLCSYIPETYFQEKSIILERKKK